MAIHNLINAPASVTLASGITAAATSLTVNANLGINAPFKATFVSTGEIIEVGTVVGTAWSNITRGAEGTIPSAYAAGAAIELRLTAGHLTERQPFNVYPSSDPAENTANIRAAIAEGYVSLAPGVYTVSAPSGETSVLPIAITESRGIEFEGNGSTIVLASGTATDIDLFHITTVDTRHTQTYRFRNFTARPYADMQGRHCLHFDLTGNTNIGFITHGIIENVYIGARNNAGATPQETFIEFGGYAVYLTNPTCYDGFAYNWFSNMRIIGALYFQRLGDSVKFDRLTINSHEKIGISIASVVPGAGNVILDSCTAVCEKGSVYAKDVLSLQLRSCNMEHAWGAAPTHGAVVYLENCNKPTITDTRAARVAGTAEMHGLYAVGCTGLTVTNCLLGGYGTGGKDLFVDATSTLTYPPTAAQAAVGNYLYQGESYVTIGGTTRAAI